ncbi:hypothetical protein [Clostridium ganghwense]|uniref:Uncharacterized protein n=1 Tax=Clostridium ganghwense TaxID=312089 RepID=A0ABT4CSW9_9CLOT|nr:hypothetical protein [Clostridium ganghwense]MCY6372152.1 hypothetical protein [Clostridium ganghwense]
MNWFKIGNIIFVIMLLIKTFFLKGNSIVVNTSLGIILVIIGLIYKEKYLDSKERNKIKNINRYIVANKRFYIILGILMIVLNIRKLSMFKDKFSHSLLEIFHIVCVITLISTIILYIKTKWDVL